MLRSNIIIYNCFQAMIDTLAEHGWLVSTLVIIQLLQMIIQARWIDESAIITLPHLNSEHLQLFSSLPKIFPMLCNTVYDKYNLLLQALAEEFQENEIYEVNTIEFVHFIVIM